MNFNESNKKVKSNMLFRLESFGGILISKTNFKRIELTMEEALFIYALQYTRPFPAQKIVCEILHKETIDISRVMQLDIFEDASMENLLEYASAYNRVYFKYNHIKALSFLSFPLEISIYPSMRCNLNCKFCFVGSKKDHKVYSADQWGMLLDEAKSHGLLSVSILGGEPSLYYDIDRLLMKCESLELNTVITTNAMQWKESTKEIVFGSKHITPVVSLQSLDNLNNLLMGCDSRVQQSFIEECLLKGKEVRINSVYTFQTPEQILSIYDYCAEVGIKRYSVANYSNVKDNTEMRFSHTLQDLAELDGKVKHHIEENYPSIKDAPIFSAEGCLLYSCYGNQVSSNISFSPFEKQYFACRGKFTKMEIYSDGSVYPCCRYETIRPSTSNAFYPNSTLKSIWEHDTNYKELRMQKTKNADCLKCAFVEICQGGCYPSRLKGYGDSVESFRDSNCQFQVEKTKCGETHERKS